MFTKSINALHADQRGTISILSVFAVMLLTMLLGMVMNVGRHVDGKIRLQNAADDAAYSGGVAMARGMNTLAFTNHLLCDMFAVTAFLREARDRNAESFVPSILEAWKLVAPVFSTSGFPKFNALGPAIQQKVPLEQELVRTYSEWAAATSRQLLPLVEEILLNELIPKYQRAVVASYPRIAQAAAMASADRNGQPNAGRGKMLGVLWQTSGQVVGQDAEGMAQSMPVVDPVLGNEPDQAEYFARARRQRDQMASQYLRDWNREAMAIFDREAKMSQFAALWRSFTAGQLEKLIEEEFPNTNLPQQILNPPDAPSARQEYLQQRFVFLGVSYWRKLPGILPKLFTNPIEGDAQAFAEVHLFVPRGRLVWLRIFPGGGRGDLPLGGVPGDFPSIPADSGSGPSGGGGAGRWVVGRQGVPADWSLMNQSWACQLSPAVQPALADILQTVPEVPGFAEEGLTVPSLGGVTGQQLEKVNTH